MVTGLSKVGLGVGRNPTRNHAHAHTTVVKTSNRAPRGSDGIPPLPSSVSVTSILMYIANYIIYKNNL